MREKERTEGGEEGRGRLIPPWSKMARVRGELEGEEGRGKRRRGEGSGGEWIWGREWRRKMR